MLEGIFAKKIIRFAACLFDTVEYLSKGRIWSQLPLKLYIKDVAYRLSKTNISLIVEINHNLIYHFSDIILS